MVCFVRFSIFLLSIILKKIVALEQNGSVKLDIDFMIRKLLRALYYKTIFVLLISECYLVKTTTPIRQSACDLGLTNRRNR